MGNGGWLRRAMLAAVWGSLAVLVAAPVAAAQKESAREDRTLFFELFVEGGPPAGNTFTAIMPGANLTELTDPDGDGVYTGSLDADLRTYPRCVPVGVFGDTPDEPSYPIRDERRFCFEDGDMFSASISFDGASAGGQAGSDDGVLVGEYIVGTYGDDLLNGGAGDDRIAAEAGADRVDGNAGDDALYTAYDLPASAAPNAPASPDTVHGGGGDDFIDSADAAGAPDAVDCGPGNDLVHADAEDFVDDESCEAIVRF